MQEILKKPWAWLALLLTVALSYACATYMRDGGKPESVHHEPYNAVSNNVATDQLSASSLEPPPAPDQSFMQCLGWAASNYQVPVDALMGIMRVEGGHSGQAIADRNGTYDLGVMQINTLWVPQLARLWHVDYATAYRAVRDNGCENVYVGAWVLKQKIAQTGTIYNGIADYHSATPSRGMPYADKVTMRMTRH